MNLFQDALNRDPSEIPETKFTLEMLTEAMKKVSVVGMGSCYDGSRIWELAWKRYRGEIFLVHTSPFYQWINQERIAFT